MTSVSSSSPRAFRSFSSAGDRLIDGAAVVLMPFDELAVLIPTIGADAGTGHFDEPHAPLDQPPRRQADRARTAASVRTRRRGRTASCVSAVSSAKFITSGTAVCMRYASS